MTTPRGSVATVSLLAAGGALGFWLANLALSRTPIAAAYRNALSIPYGPMLLEAAVGGLVVGLFVSCAVLRWPPRAPGSCLRRSLMFSGVALAVATLVLEVPATFAAGLSDPWRWFVVGTVFNALRILALGAVIGLLRDRVTLARAGGGVTGPGSPSGQPG